MIHGIGVVLSLMHQRITIWRNDGIMENIKADQSYFIAEVNHVERCHFDKNLTNIAPCNPSSYSFLLYDNSYCFLYFHPTQGFQWDQNFVKNEDPGNGGT